MSLLAKQLEAFRKEQGISSVPRKHAPTILFSAAEVKNHDSDSFAALALTGLTELTRTDPDLAAFARLFTGPPRERDLLTRSENDALNKDIRRLLLLLSPHLPTRAAQECVEGLLHNYDVHFHNLEDLLACALPFHDSPVFTKLVQCLEVESTPRWSWLQKLKAEPATLVRSILAKYCAKDTSLLAFVADTVQEYLRLQKTHRALSSFFAALWMDTLGHTGLVRQEMVEAVLPTVLLVLRKPRLRDSFHAGAIVAAAICLKAELAPPVKAQLLERMSRHVAMPGSSGGAGAAGEQRAAAALMSLLSQVQPLDDLPEKALLSLAAVGPEALVNALPPGLDSTNFTAVAVEACVGKMAVPGAATDPESEQPRALLAGLVEAAAGAGDHTALAAACACLRGHSRAVAAGVGEEAASVLRDPLAKLAALQPVAASQAFKEAVDRALQAGESTAPLMELMAPSCSTMPGGAEGGMLPVLQALSHKSAKIRAKAVRTAAKDLDAGDGSGDVDDMPRRRLLAGLILKALEDDDTDVVKAALSQGSLWSVSRSLSASSAATALLALAARLFPNKVVESAADAPQASLYVAALLQSERTRVLLPHAIRCFSQVYARGDFGSEELRRRLDAELLPLIALCAAGLDAATEPGGALPEKQEAASKDLRESVVQLAADSAHPSLKGLADLKAAGSLVACLATAADVETIQGLCRAVEGGAGSVEVLGSDGQPAATQPMQVLGGLAAQAAAASILGAAVPRLVDSLPASEVATARSMVQRCSEACRQLSSIIAAAPKAAHGACTEPLRSLVGALFAAAAQVDAPKKRKGSAPPVSPQIHAVATTLLCIMLERPKAFAAELRAAVSQRRDLLRPALLCVALSTSELPGLGRSALPGSVANALLLLRSLLSSKSTEHWTADHSLLLPALCQLATAADSEVRGAALSLLESLRAAAPAPAWGSPMQQALREAGVLRQAGEVLPQQAWSSLPPKTTGLPETLCAALVDQLQGHRAEIMQDRAAVGLALKKFFASKDGKKFGSDANACNFWILGLSLVPQVSPAAKTAVAEVLRAAPGEAMLAAAQEPLRAAAAELSSIEGAAVGTAGAAPTALLAAAAQLASAAFSTPGKQLAVADTFLKESALPVLDALAQAATRTGALELGDHVVDLVSHLCTVASLSVSTAATATPSVHAETAATSLLGLAISALGTQAVAAGADGPEEDEADGRRAGVGKVVAMARTALVDATPQVGLLRSLLSSPAVQAVQGPQAMEVLYPVMCALDGSAEGVGGLLSILANFVLKLAKGMGEVPLAESPIHFALLSVAAISEALFKAAAADVDVDAVCKPLKGAAAALGSRLDADFVGASLRALAALAPLARPGGQEPPAPLVACTKILSTVPTALRSDVLLLLQGGLRRFWQFPADADASGSPPATRDALCQARLRSLLHALVLQNPRLLGAFGHDQCLALATSAGLTASLDFLLLALLVRRVAPAAPKAKKSKRKKLHRDDGIDAAIVQVEEWMATPDDDIADEAVRVLTSVTMGARFHVLASLMQTLVSLSSVLASAAAGEDGEALAANGLLPAGLCSDIGDVAAGRALDVGLLTVVRFVSEHGFPRDLDEGAFELDAYPRSLEPAAGDARSTAASAMSYVAKGACTMEALLKDAAKTDDKKLAPALTRVQELRGLVLRSLAVNHPLTYFKAACLSLRIPALSPAAFEGGSPGERALVLRVFSEALEQRREIRPAAVGDADEEEDSAACADLCAAAVQHVCKQLAPAGKKKQAAAKAVGVHDVAWRFLDELCRFGGRHAPKTFVDVCVPAAAKCLQSFAADFPLGSETPDTGGARETRAAVAASALSFLHNVAEQLGKGVMDQLPAMAEAMLAVVAETSEEAPGAEVLHGAALRALKALIQAVGHFLSPFLPRILDVATRPSPAWKTPLLEDVARELVTGVRHRLLLPALQTATTASLKRLDADEEAASGDAAPSTELISNVLVGTQRFAVIHAWVFAAAQPDFVASFADAAGDSVVRMLSTGSAASRAFLRASGNADAIPTALLRRKTLASKVPDAARWEETCADASLALLLDLAASAHTQFALRLSVEELRPRFSKILKWARGPAAGSLMSRQASRKASAMSEEDAFPDAEDACRALGVLAIMHSLTREAPEITEELFLPLALKDVSTCLAASRRYAIQVARQSSQAKKKRRTLGGDTAARPLATSTWWWLEVATAALGFISIALRQADAGTMREKAVEEAAETLTDPCAGLLALFEHLPPMAESPISDALAKHIQDALVSMTRAAGGDHRKRLVVAVMERCRADDAEVRLAAVKTCHRLWLDLGVQVVSSLSEVVMHASELFEDEDSRVEGAARALVKTMEECTGESLQEALKK